MKKRILPLIISLLCSHAQAMQQMGAQAASRALASTLTPALKEAKRTFYQKPIKEIQFSWPHKFVPLISEKMELTPDPTTESYYKQKYPSLKVPKFYTHQGKYIPAGAISPFVSRQYGVYPEGFIIHNPAKFASNAEHEFVMLHELGHIRHDTSRFVMRQVQRGVRYSFILAAFLKLISIKYGLLGAFFAPRLFYTCYLRFYEEPSADNFAIKHSDLATLRGGKQFFEKLPFGRSRVMSMLFDHKHPNNRDRINKVQRAIDGTHQPYQLAKFVLLMSLVEYSIYLMHKHSKDEESILAGLAKVQEIEDNFEDYCDKWEIPAEGRPTWKYCLETVKVYLQDRLEQVKTQQEIAALTQTSKDLFREEALLGPAVI